jgi:ABC-type molybdate transport system substrate-binding protein
MLLLCLGGRVMAADDKALVLYGAGSLREAMTEIAEHFTTANGIAVRTGFGASGRMRERIEAGDNVDVFTSADIGHARKLVHDGRATVMAMFAQNTLCLLVPARFGPVTSGNALDALLRDCIRVGVSPARIDPLGDYTVALFEVADKLRPGAAQRLQARAVVLDNPPGAPRPRTGDYYLDALADGKIDAAIVYCSGRDRYGRLSADTAFVDFPEALQVGPQYGLAVLKDAKPAAMLLALTILSPEGQAILARNGFKPVGLPASR